MRSKPLRFYYANNDAPLQNVTIHSIVSSTPDIQENCFIIWRVLETDSLWRFEYDSADEY